MDADNDFIETFDSLVSHNSVEFSLPFEGDDSANFDYTFPQPPPEKPVPAPNYVPDGAGSKRTRKRKSREPATNHASVVTTAQRDLLVILESKSELRSPLLIWIGGKLIKLILI